MRRAWQCLSQQAEAAFSAAGLIYTIGGSLWEFGGPDLERAKLFVMIGTAEDHHSNPMKISLSKFKRRGSKFVSINPIRTTRRVRTRA